MAKKASNSSKRLWDGLTESDFIDEPNVSDVEIHEYVPEIMNLFSANLNYARQLTKIDDGLKPVERRILYSMYLAGLKWNSKAVKSANVVGEAMTWHPHADGSIYKTLIGMSQYWKKSISPVQIIGNNGSVKEPDNYGQTRYTECRLSRYGWECFFEDYDPNCVEMALNYTKDKMEPVVLPSRYPHILLNGGTGIAVGNTYSIPPYRAEDVVGLVKKLMKNPHARDCVLIPDIPTGCQLIDDGNFVKIAETGRGVLTMRSIIDISEGEWSPSTKGRNARPVWILTIRSIPWMTSFDKIIDDLIALQKNKELNILDIKDNSQGYFDENNELMFRIETEIIIDHNLDPYQIRQLLYRKTNLQKAQSIEMKAVNNDLKVVTMSLRDIVLEWIDVRREYKRRFYNRKLVDYMTDISFYEILVRITEEDMIEKVVGILRRSDEDKQVEDLVKLGNMSSHQAARILDSKFKIINKNANMNARANLEATQVKLEETKEILRSEKKIDEIILSELDGLKKYYQPRFSEVININNEKTASEQKVTLVVTKKGKVKKIPDHTGNKTQDEIRDIFTGVKNKLGVFDQYDYPTYATYLHNYDAVTFIDSLGRFSTIPVNIIPNTETSNPGYRLYDFTRLDGEIIDCFECSTPEEDTQEIQNVLGEDVHQVFLSAQGMIKQVPLSEFMITGTAKKKLRNKCIKLKEDDTLAWTGAMLSGTNLLIYTRKGEYAYVNAGNIPLSNASTMGNIGVKCAPGDSCVGCAVIDDSPYLVIVTAKGCVKRVETDFLGEPGKRMRSSYLATVADNDDIILCVTARDDEELVIVSKSGMKTLPIEDIPIMGRKGKPKKLIPVALGDVISTVYTRKIQE